MAAAERRGQLVETATRLFSKGSYRATTTKEIARAAGVTQPILYRHFASKRDLYFAALDHVWGGAKAAWEQALMGEQTVAEGFELIACSYFSVRDCRFPLAEMWVEALGEATEDPEFKKRIRKHIREVHDFLADAIRQGQTESSLHPDRDPRAEAWMFMTGGLGGMVGRRVGFLGELEVDAIRASQLARLRA